MKKYNTIIQLQDEKFLIYKIFVKINGTIDASSRDGAIEMLQQRGIVITSLSDKEEKTGFSKSFSFF